MQNTKRALEAIKKICKKYRFMFRSDDLYREMNYMIENLSPSLLNNLLVSKIKQVNQLLFQMAGNALNQSQTMGAEGLP